LSQPEAVAILRTGDEPGSSLAPRPLLSIIIPVYNERATAARLIDLVLAVELQGVDREVVIVESNSTDGTREAMARYVGRAGVTVIWENRPRGKGHAVRTGLRSSKGDIILIQDADLEYSVDDYENVLQPILNRDTAFVLGSRHTGNNKIRSFEAQPLLAWLLNIGHLCFAGLINLLCATNLRDPFTMYKVFRRECLTGIDLRRNGFDFDIELVIKLIRRGYVPVEVPVAYCSRSFADGKKIRVLRDPWTWVWAAITSRFERL